MYQDQAEAQRQQAGPYRASHHPPNRTSGFRGVTPKADQTHHKRFANFFRRQVEGQDFDNTEQQEYGVCHQIPREHILSLTNVVVTTVSNSGDAALHAIVFRASLTVILTIPIYHPGCRSSLC